MKPRQVRCARVYDERSPEDGYRVLVDRLWPRGLRKDSPAMDEWVKHVAPSSELRRWYGHDPAKYAEFRRRYRRELSTPEGGEALRRLGELSLTGPVTLLTSSKHLELSHVRVLAELLAGENGTSAAG